MDERGTIKEMDKDWLNLIVAAVALAATIWVLWIELRRDRDDKPRLRVVVNPTRDGEKQLAQIRLFNEGRRPIHLTSWYETYEGSAQVSVREPLPATLREQEPLDFTVELSETGVTKLKQIGVIDAAQQRWPATDENMQRFIETAIRYAPGTPEDCAFQKAMQEAMRAPSLFTPIDPQ